jgi:hypothetical protein
MKERRKILVEMAMYWCLCTLTKTNVKPTSLENSDFTFVIVNNLHDPWLDKNMENI